MNQDFTVKKKAIFVWKKKIVQRGSPAEKKKKKNPAEAVSEKKKNSYKLKIPQPPHPHHFSNGPSLTLFH